MEQRQHIVALEAQNIMPLKAVSLDVDGKRVIQITGRNGQGKSTLLDAIALALCGGKISRDKIIRKGEDSGYIKVTTEQIEVTITYKLNEQGDEVRKISVSSVSGGKVTSPQKLLDELGAAVVAVDPLAMARQATGNAASRKELMQTVIDLSGLPGYDYQAEVANKKRLYDERTIINRETQRLQAVWASIPVSSEDTPDCPVSASTVLDTIRETEGQLRDVQGREQQLQAVRQERERLQARMDELAATEYDLEQGLVDAPEEDSLAGYINRLRERVAAVDTINEQVRQKQRKAEAQKSHADSASRAAILTNLIEELDVKRNLALSRAIMPVPGLGFDFDNEELTYNGVPFSQASDGQRINVAVGILIAQNPVLSIIRIKEGSLLDNEMFSAITEMAAQNGFQVWVENVHPQEGTFTIEIENGEVNEWSTY